EPGCGGLVALPFFNGERTPDLPGARACFIGLGPHNSGKGHLLRATVEGATFALRFGLDELEGLGHAGTEIVLTGGGANSRVWRQIVADVTNLPVTLLEQQEGASFGAALHALWTLERHSDPARRCEQVVGRHLTRDEARSTPPDPDAVEVYAERYADYRRALVHVTPLFSTTRGTAP